MTRSAKRYGKDFAVVETGYGRGHIQNNPFMLWPETPEGRLQFMVDLVNRRRRHTRTVGFYHVPADHTWPEFRQSCASVRQTLSISVF